MSPHYQARAFLIRAIIHRKRLRQARVALA